MRIVRAADLVRTPWKNGGGETAEIAVHPPGAGFADFGWRISLATVAGGGLFSWFGGVDRTLTILTGEGMDLTIDGHEYRLTAASAPLAFPGDVPAAANLIGGPVTDLNVMTRRGVFSHRVERIGPGLIATSAGGTVAVVATEAVRIDASDLATGDAAFLEPDEGAVLHGGSALLIRIHPSGAQP